MTLDMEELQATLAECVEYQRAGEPDEACDAGKKLLHLLGLSDLLRETLWTKLGPYMLRAPVDVNDDVWCVLYEGQPSWGGDFSTRAEAMKAIMEHRQSVFSAP